jgi:hypothetical protein
MSKLTGIDKDKLVNTIYSHVAEFMDSALTIIHKHAHRLSEKTVDGRDVVDLQILTQLMNTAIKQTYDKINPK